MRDIFGNEHVTDKMCLNVLKSIFDVLQAIIFGTRIYVQILVLQGFVELSDVVKSGGIYSVRNAFATRLQQKYLKNYRTLFGDRHWRVSFLLCGFCIGSYAILIF